MSGGWIWAPDGRGGGSWRQTGFGASQPELPGYVSQEAHAQALAREKKRGYVYAAAAYGIGAIMGAVFYGTFMTGGRR